MILTLLALLIHGGPAGAAPLTLGCTVITRDNPSRIPVNGFFTLEKDQSEQEFYRAGPVSYTVRRIAVGNQEIGVVEYLEIWVRDHSRDLDFHAARPLGATYREDLQVWPPFNLPLAICTPRPAPDALRR